MSKNNGTEFGDAPHGETDSIDGRQESRDTLSYMTDAGRRVAFLAIAALVDSGLDVVDAGLWIADEYERDNRDKEARSLRKYFEVVSAAKRGNGQDIVQGCREAFGKTFVGLEEGLVLSRVHASPSPAETLRDAAGIILLTNGSGGFRSR